MSVSNHRVSVSLHDFSEQDYIVYPAHGVGQITAIEVQEVAGIKLELFIVHFSKAKLNLKVPVSKAIACGMRKLADRSDIEQAITAVTNEPNPKKIIWSRRLAEYDAKLNSGNLVDLAALIKQLSKSDDSHSHSYSERQIYEVALNRLASEVAVVYNIDQQAAIAKISSMISD